MQQGKKKEKNKEQNEPKASRFPLSGEWQIIQTDKVLKWVQMGV